MKKIRIFACAILCSGVIASVNLYAESETAIAKLNVSAPDGIRPGGTLDEDLPAPKIAKQRITTGPAHRNYPEQPPMIPHNIRDYQIDKNFNMCLSCHSRNASPQTGATAVSITHYYDRDGQALAAVSPRRYFCVQCHMPQADVAPTRANNFHSIDTLIQQQPRAE